MSFVVRRGLSTLIPPKVCLDYHSSAWFTDTGNRLHLHR